MITLRTSMAIITIVALASCAPLRKSNNKNLKLEPEKREQLRKSSIEDSTKSKLSSYDKLIGRDALTQRGLVTTHKVGNKIYLEIADSIFEKEMLVVSRILYAAAGNRAGTLGYAGDQVNEQIIGFYKGPNNKVFLRSYNYNERSRDSSNNGMYRVVNASNVKPIIASFDTRALSNDSSSVVIDITDYLNGDNSTFFFHSSARKALGLGALQADKSYVDGINTYPQNIEVRSFKTYLKGDNIVTYGLNTSIILLPKATMRPRYSDERVGYFFRKYLDFDQPEGAKSTAMITRWRLEPKPEDQEKYLRGELVEPAKPIIFYIDPATPKKWVPYLISGVNAWQKAFEKAGFKKAIYAMEAPTNDSSWSLYDCRHSAIVYKPSTAQNASGPHIHDPRTGEILESHINWYHNIQKVLKSWYFIQVAPNDRRAQKAVFDDDLLGELIKYVCTHEVGHTLGLTHNFGASYTVPADSLRSRHYLMNEGFTPSIMDYARFNYAVQPQDSIDASLLLPRIGIYDEWAIEWGYRWLPNFEDARLEKRYMNNWIMSKLKADKRYRYGKQELIVSDYRNQPEDIGDDAVKIGEWGVENLKIVLDSLLTWTYQPDGDYDNSRELYMQLVGQFRRYIMHVANNIGLYSWTPRKVEEREAVVSFIPKAKQKKAVEFLHRHLFDTPEWLVRKDQFAAFGGSGLFTYGELQLGVLERLMDFLTYTTMAFSETLVDKDSIYSFDELLGDLEKGIWKELNSAVEISPARRILQNLYTEKLIEIVNAGSIVNPLAGGKYKNVVLSEYLPIGQRHAMHLISKIEQRLRGKSDKTSTGHLRAVVARLKAALDPERIITPTAGNTQAPPNRTDDSINVLLKKNEKADISNDLFFRDCWNPTQYF